MKNLNPILPVPVLIVLSVIAVLLMLFVWIRNKEGILKRTFGLFRRLAIVALVFVIALRPMREEHGVDIQLSNLDVIFVLDTTLSMWADDAPYKTRFETAKKDIETIIDELPGANIGLITFQNNSSVLAPFTQDEETVLGLINSIQTPVQTYMKGSRLDAPYYDLENFLISSDRKENRQVVVFFLSDGEVTHASDTPFDYSLLGELVDGGAVIGYGTEEGGKMIDKNGYTVCNSKTKEEAVSCIDENNLKNIADGLGIEYIHRVNNTIFSSLVAEIRASSRTVSDTKYENVIYHDTYYKYVPYLVILLLAELTIRIRENARVRKKHGKKNEKKQTKE